MSPFETELLQVADLPGWSDFATPRKGRYLLGRLFQALVLAPEDLLLNTFEPWDEADLVRTSQVFGEQLDRHGGQTLLSGDQTVASRFRTGVVILRYLDDLLSETPRAQTDHDLKQLTYDRFHVIPSIRHHGGKSAARGHGLRRRGLNHHRVVPRVVDAYSTRLVLHENVTGPHPTADWKIGAALFPGMDLHCTAADQTATAEFIAEAVRLEGAAHDHDTLVKSHVGQAQDAGCSILVWPELTMPTDAVKTVSDLLAETHLNRDLPPVVVAGSWHVRDGQGNRNRSRILNGYGDEMFYQDKALKYFARSDGGPVEHIEPGKVINLLVTDRDLIGVLICLDFCHEMRAALLDQLDLSMAIVPSMGAQTTVNAHRTRAKSLSISRGTRTVVVQQVLPNGRPDSGASGFVCVVPAPDPPIPDNSEATHSHFISFQLGSSLGTPS